MLERIIEVKMMLDRATTTLISDPSCVQWCVAVASTNYEFNPFIDDINCIRINILNVSFPTSNKTVNS